jgi:hypothetical protein
VSSAGGWESDGDNSFDWHRQGRRGSPAGAGDTLRYDYSDSQEELRIEEGARVVHPRFGGGRIRSVAGEGRRTKAEIEFDDGIRRKVMVAHAGLRPA